MWAEILGTVSIRRRPIRRSARVRRKTPQLRRRSTTMRFLGYTLANEADMPTEPPPPELYEEMGAFVEEAVKAGVIVATGGIAPSAQGTKITLQDGQFTVVDGPFTEAKELVGGWALMECRDMDEAIEWTKRFLSVLGAGESRVRPVM